MDDLWRFRQIQSNICPVCSTSHFPFCPPPPAFGYLAVDGPRCFAPDLNPPPFHRQVQDPPLVDHRNPPPPPPFPSLRDPNPPCYPSGRFLHEEFLERDGFRKRMRVEDPYPFSPPPLPQHQRTSLDNNERMLSLIREHGRQDSAPVSDQRFNPVSIQQNHYLQADSFDGYQRFDDFPRPRGIDRFLPPERRDFYGGEVETVRTGPFSSQIGSSSDRLEEKYVNQLSDEPHFPDSRSPFARDRPFYPNEISSYALPKQPQYRQSEYPHLESYHVEPKVANDEQESHYPLPYPSLRPLLEDNIQLQNHPLPYPNLRVTLEDNIELRNQQRNHFEPKPPVFDEIRKPFEPDINPVPYESNDYRMDSAVISQASHTSQMYPPLPPQPPLPPPPEPSPPPRFQEKLAPPPMPSPVPIATSAPLFPTQPTTSAPLFPTQPTTSAPLFPTQPTTSAPLFLTQPNSQSFSESRLPTWSSFYDDTAAHTSTGFVAEGLPFIHQTPSKEYMEGRGQAFPPGRSLKVKPTVIDACDLFRQPNRASRPDHIVVILRGLPGSGKSYLAKALRDLEVESGGNAPRIHAMDDYFMIEVEKKVEENEGSKSSGSYRGKKQIAKKVIEYCYEPEMEEAYRSSMLKAFKKTLDEGNFTFIIVDDRNLRVADFAQFWAIAKRSGYEVYLLEASYKDPTGCAVRNVHGFTVEDIQKMAEQWEEAPSLYLQLDIQSLFRGDNLNEQSIQEVDMDTDDAVCDEEETNKLQQSVEMKTTKPISSDRTLDGGFVKIGERWNADEEEEELTGVKDLGSSKWSKELAGVKDLGSSKWSKDVDEVIGNSDGAGRHLSALSGLIQAYGKSGKSVHWGDQVEQSGFSIGAVKKQSRSSLVIGPGSGYNLSSNPVQEDDGASQPTGRSNINESKRRFTERLQAERESFKAVFDRRKQRIGGLWDTEDE